MIPLPWLLRSAARLLIIIALQWVLLLPCTNGYSNFTLSSNGGDIKVVVYLPHGVKPNEPTYYMGSRFDHGSMIGSIKRRSHGIVRTLFGGSLWRLPHNNQWPESGIGLASEFGVGDDGPLCQYRCGWDGVNDVSNGVLGYDDVKNGEAFLKIGVGALIKGSCPLCDSTDTYRFNSPYEFAELPQWKIVVSTDNVVSMEHEAYVKHHGYRLHKDIVLDGNVLAVTSVLTNLGDYAFSTAWYSHNFFSCDSIPVQKGYGVDLDIRERVGAKLYEEPGVLGSWAAPLRSFAHVEELRKSIEIEVVRPLEDDTRIKAEFVKDEDSRGTFTLHGCGTAITSQLPDVEDENLPMYAYNLYLEKGTLSPEPQILLNLAPGQTVSWTQRLSFEDDYGDSTGSYLSFASFSLFPPSHHGVWMFATATLLLAGAVLALHMSNKRLLPCRSSAAHYDTVPDVA
jgi:hypothetical protein